MSYSKTLWLTCVTVLALIFGHATLLLAETTASGAPVTFTVKVTGAGRPMILIPGLRLWRRCVG